MLRSFWASSNPVWWCVTPLLSRFYFLCLFHAFLPWSFWISDAPSQVAHHPPPPPPPVFFLIVMQRNGSSTRSALARHVRHRLQFARAALRSKSSRLRGKRERLSLAGGIQCGVWKVSTAARTFSLLSLSCYSLVPKKKKTYIPPPGNVASNIYRVS